MLLSYLNKNEITVIMLYHVNIATLLILSEVYVKSSFLRYHKISCVGVLRFFNALVSTLIAYRGMWSLLCNIIMDVKGKFLY